MNDAGASRTVAPKPPRVVPASSARVPQLLLVALLLLAAAAVGWLVLRQPDQAAQAAPADAPSITIGQAEVCLRAPVGDAIPVAGCDWKTMALPALWHGAADQPMSDAWYRLHFRLDVVPPHGIALYVVKFNRTGRVFLNSQYVRQIGAMTPPLPLNWNRSQYMLLPPGLLRAGDNEIELQQRIYGWEPGWLSQVRLGPEARMLEIWHQRVFWQNDLVRILGVSSAVMGLFMLGVWLGRRSHVMYFWFGCVLLLWTGISLDYFALYPPLPARLWERCMEAAQVLRGVLMFIFVLRYCQQRRPLLELGFWAYFLLGTAAIFGEILPLAAMEVYYLLMIAASAFFCVMLVREGLRNSRLEGAMMAVATAAQFGLSGYDLLLFSRSTVTDSVYLSHFSAPLFLGVVGVALARRFVESLNAYEALAGVLEQRVSEKASELQRNYEQLLEARRNQALALERARIMSEMHDGIGSQLTMALSLVRRMDREAHPDGDGEDGQVATVLRESIEDLQLIIDSLEPVENDLLTVLGTLRYRVQDRLGKSGIELQWNVVDLPPLPMLTPHSVLSILRIVQEAFANCLKHSGATRITVSTGLGGRPGRDETAHISIVDNGRGIVGTRVGRGLENMRQRAIALGGSLRVTSKPGITEVLLVIPTLRAVESRS